MRKRLETVAVAAGLLLGFASLCTGGTGVQEDHDALENAVVIEAAEYPNSEDRSRGGRGVLWGEKIEEGGGGPCLTSKGEVGRCATFRECYPYFKVPDLGALDGWVLGVYDTCSYIRPDHRMAFGVCCSNPSSLIPPESPSDGDTSDDDTPIIEDAQDEDKDQTVDREMEMKPRPRPPASWPPPLPTHPPHHTIPPLPTHPIYPAFPVNSPKPPNPTTKRPGATTWPTKNPGSWWPGPTTQGTTKRPATNAPASGSAVCGAKNGNQDQNRIVGGHSAKPGEWPWIAALFNAGRQFCGGSLIDDKHILSAAHCVAHMNSWDVAKLTVRLGDHNIKTNYEVRHVERRVKRIVRHRGFDSRTLYNDVAILTMDQPVPFTDQIRPICLPSGSQLYAGKIATVIGWGSLQENGQQPAVLQEVTVPVWANTECKVKYGAAAPGGIVESFICAGVAAKDSCSGDSGGPLMVNDGRWTQVGIVSWGIGCGKGQYPGVYTRITHFLPWINKNLK